MPHRKQPSLMRTLIGTVLIVLMIIICSASFIGAMDIYCHNDINYWMPLYPNAQLVEMQRGGFFRPRASGITLQTYHTADDPTTVRTWYRNYRQTLTSRLSSESSADMALSGIATTDYTITDEPQATGSLITYYSECAYN